jgi:hypothetical protein
MRYSGGSYCISGIARSTARSTCHRPLATSATACAASSPARPPALVQAEPPAPPQTPPPVPSHATTVGPEVYRVANPQAQTQTPTKNGSNPALSIVPPVPGESVTGVNEFPTSPTSAEPKRAHRAYTVPSNLPSSLNHNYSPPTASVTRTRSVSPLPPAGASVDSGDAARLSAQPMRPSSAKRPASRPRSLLPCPVPVGSVTRPRPVFDLRPSARPLSLLPLSHNQSI